MFLVYAAQGGQAVMDGMHQNELYKSGKVGCLLTKNDISVIF